MSNTNASDPPLPTPKTSRPVSEALLNEKVRCTEGLISSTKLPGGTLFAGRLCQVFGSAGVFLEQHATNGVKIAGAAQLTVQL